MEPSKEDVSSILCCIYMYHAYFTCVSKVALKEYHVVCWLHKLNHKLTKIFLKNRHSSNSTYAAIFGRNLKNSHRNTCI